MTGGSQSKGISLSDTLKRQKSPTRGSYMSQSASQTKETSKPYHMKPGYNNKKKTAGDGDPDDPDNPSGEESGYSDDDRRPDRHRSPDKEEEAKATDGSVREITSSMKEWETVTGKKQKPSAQKSKQLATARGLAEIRDPETCDGKSQKWREQITFDEWGQRVVKWLLWQEYDIQGEEALDRASFLLTDSAGIWYNMYERETEPEDRNIHSFLCLRR